MNYRLNELLILGNGPSLKDYRLSDFADRRTLGMNAAYRYWRRIDWRPDYYCCLDDALIDTHKDAILDLIAEKRIERFFLSGRILEHHPELSRHPGVFFLDQFVEHWHRVRGTKFDLSLIEHIAFQTDDPDMLTTGAYSVRFGAYLGFDLIRLLGVDLNYVEIPDVRQIEGTRLEVTDTPDQNPNYFFDDYQITGDHFNVANPEQHGRELHLHSFITLRNDFIRNAVNVRLLNGAKKSRLFGDAILPYDSISPATPSESQPASVQLVLHASNATAHSLSNMLRLWDQPAFIPSFKQRPGVHFLMVTEHALSGSERDGIKSQIESSAHLKTRFETIRFAASDSASRLASPIQDEQNQDQATYDFRIELDEFSIPMTSDWLTRLIEQYGEENLTLEIPPDSVSHWDLDAARNQVPNAVILKSSRLTGWLANKSLKTMPASFQELVSGDPALWTAQLSSSIKKRTPFSTMKSVFRKRN